MRLVSRGFSKDGKMQCKREWTGNSVHSNKRERVGEGKIKRTRDILQSVALACMSNQIESVRVMRKIQQKGKESV